MVETVDVEVPDALEVEVEVEEAEEEEVTVDEMVKRAEKLISFLTS